MVDLEEISRVREEAKLLYPETEVEQAIDRMAATIERELSRANPVVLCVLNGGIVITGKLLPRLPFPLQLDSVHATRYGGAVRGRELRWLHEPATDLEGRTVLLVDDILDEGFTLAAIRDYCLAKGSLEVRTAVLLDKRLPGKKPCEADYVGLSCVNRYVFGYGMDYRGYLRNMAGIYACPGIDE